MSDPLIQPNDLRRRIEKRYQQRGEFMTHLVVFVLVNVVLWALWGGLVQSLSLQWLLSFPWPMVVSLGWGSGLAAHGLTVYYEAGAPAVRLEERIADEMYELHGADWQHTAPRKGYEEVRQALTQGLNQRKEVIIHGAVYILINVMLWWISRLLPQYMPDSWTILQFPWPLLVSVGWGIGLVAHAAQVFFSSGFSAAAREAAIQREMERVYGASSEKPKRDAAYQRDEKRKRDRLMLTDDGELLEIVGEDEEDRRENL